MMDAWERARALADKHAQDGGIFVRLVNDGDKVVGAFCGEPAAREVVWNEDHYEAFDLDKHPDKRPSLRVMMNFYVPAEGRMRVFEGGSRWFGEVYKVRRKFGFADWLFEIVRHGEAGSTRTEYSVLPETRIDEALRARLAAAPLHHLAAISKGRGESSAAGRVRVVPGTRTPIAPPFPPLPKKGADVVDIAVAHGFMAELRMLPRPDVDAFLKRFSIARVRDLKAADEAAARRFIDEARRRHVPSALDQPEVDPFAP